MYVHLDTSSQLAHCAIPQSLMFLHSSRTIGSPEQNTRRSQSVATASELNTPTHVGMTANDGQQASNRIVCVAQLFSMTDSRTERLCMLLMASKSLL